MDAVRSQIEGANPHPSREKPRVPHPLFLSNPLRQPAAASLRTPINLNKGNHVMTNEAASHATRSEPTVTRPVIFTLRAFDHLKQTQRRLKAEQGLVLNNNQVLALIFEQHAEHYPTSAAATKGARHAK